MRLPFQLIPRSEPSRRMQLLAPVVVTVLTLLAGLMIFMVLGVNAADAFKAYFIEPLSSLNGISELLLKALPLCLIGLGLGIAYRANVWNIGAEGQLIIGGIAATWVMATYHDSITDALVPLMLLAGVVGGALWASLAAWMRTRFNANEILTTLMLVYIAQSLLQYLLVGTVNTPALLQDPQGTGFPQSQQFPENALMLQMNQFFDVFVGTRLHVGIFLLLIAVPLAWLFVSRSFTGFQMKVAGLAPLAANYAGFKTNRLIWLALLVSGALAGLAGALEVAGPVGQLQDSWRPGYGFTAIIVAFLGRLHPVGILLGALLMALLTLGGEALQLAMSLPQSVSGLFQGLLLTFLLSADVLVNYRVVLRK
ncbi:ABC transporter permease [Formosimonas limnophila]|uniref:ABC transporter permease n=1 Tax=Formosimonas limnophila TaxID=1384487 RepID=A0A8J3FYA6_9BURK|nr:ABC transporter permease [Formosimonas limnophila]GHA71579.1 ABC transporter permease [Formosimonas limnophila]